MHGVTIRELWVWLAGEPVNHRVLEWAPDVAALTTALLARSHAFRFVVSPPADHDWPPTDSFADEVADAATAWLAAMDRDDPPPAVVAEHWDTIVAGLETPVTELALGRPWPLCRAILELHAIADEAAAVLAVDRPGQPGSIHRARACETLVRTGSLARLPTERLVQLPRTRTTGVGITHRSLSRYSITSVDGIPASWHLVPLRRPGAEPGARHANVVLLPWPLRIRESDFVPEPGSVRRPEREPFGFFHYKPSEPLDLDLVDRLIDAALEEVDRVDVVVLPEGCLDEAGVNALEALLERRHVSMLLTGLRPEPPAPDRFPANKLHVGVRMGGQWWHYRQNKHHRWFLDRNQIEAYNIAGALHPDVRWWEAMDIPQRTVHFLELGGGLTVAAVICEDLARLDGVAEIVRSVGPTLMVTLLLDGPQLATRWTARYAGVLADDPGTAVLTLTAFGLASRSQPGGRPPSPVIAIWKDPVRGLQEIPLAPGAQGVLLKAILGTSPRYAADGRRPADDASEMRVAGVYQLRATPSSGSAPSADPEPEGTTGPGLAEADLGVLATWAEAAAVAIAAGDVDQTLAQARPDAVWRAGHGLPTPAGGLADALAELDRLSRQLSVGIPQSGQAAAAALFAFPQDPGGVRRVVRTVLWSALSVLE